MWSAASREEVARKWHGKLPLAEVQVAEEERLLELGRQVEEVQYLGHPLSSPIRMAWTDGFCSTINGHTVQLPVGWTIDDQDY